MSDDLFDARVQCDLLGLRHDFVRHVCILVIAYDHCTNMTGAIALARDVDPDVTTVITQHPDGTLDTQYRLMRQGQWRAVLPPV